MVDAGNDGIVAELFRLKPARWNSWRAGRAALCVGLPFVFGILMNDIMTGMWVAMGCLMMVTGESSSSYSAIFKNMGVAAPIGALGYLLGYIGSLPWTIVILAMMIVGFLTAIFSRKSSALSVGTLQTLLLASIALGVPAIAPFWQPAALYLVGALLYGAVLGIEVVIRGWHSQDIPLEASGAPDQAGFAAPTLFAICLGAAYCAHWLDHNAHWFWIPLTVGLVMKPDFGSIRDRAIQRVIGTIVGVVIGAIVLVTLPKGILFVIIMATLAGLLPWAMQRSYVLQAVILTPLILMLVDVIMPGTANVDYGIQRLIDTAIGGLIVIILGYLPLRYVTRGT